MLLWMSIPERKKNNKQIIGSYIYIYSKTRINKTEIINLERVRSRNQSPR